MAPTDEPLDPRRWFAASVAIVSVAIPVLDNTILNLAVPTIMREFHTPLSSLQWVITGYSLTFATLLINKTAVFGQRCRNKANSSSTPSIPPMNTAASNGPSDNMRSRISARLAFRSLY